MIGPAAVTDEVIGVLVIGELAGSPDPMPALQADLSALPGIEVTHSAAPEHVLQHGPPPDIVVLLQQHPDEHSSQQVRTLLNTCPLSRLIVCYGPWCDSDGRTRQLWPAACRVPAGRLLPRLHRELAVVRGASPPLPLTANRDECWEGDFAADATSQGRRLRVAISTPDPAVAEWLDAALTISGHRLVGPSGDAGDVLLFDIDPWPVQRAEALASLSRSHRDLPIVALAGFPQTAGQQALRQVGVRSVAGKLAPLSELCRALEEATLAPSSVRPTLQIVRDS
jgi:hypothetical protein